MRKQSSSRLCLVAVEARTLSKQLRIARRHLKLPEKMAQCRLTRSRPSWKQASEKVRAPPLVGLRLVVLAAVVRRGRAALAV